MISDEVFALFLQHRSVASVCSIRHLQSSSILGQVVATARAENARISHRSRTDQFCSQRRGFSSLLLLQTSAMLAAITNSRSPLAMARNPHADCNRLPTDPAVGSRLGRSRWKCRRRLVGVPTTSSHFSKVLSQGGQSGFPGWYGKF